MIKLKCKKEYGTWYYKKVAPRSDNDLDGPIWELYDQNKNYVGTGAYYSDLHYFVKYGQWW